jgi:hypothetical protein
MIKLLDIQKIRHSTDFLYRAGGQTLLLRDKLHKPMLASVPLVLEAPPNKVK